MTWSQVQEIYQIGRQTLGRWLKKEQEGEIGDKKRKAYKPQKVDPRALLERVEAPPDWILREYAKLFNCSPQAIASRFKKLGITRKKKTTSYQESDEKQRQEFQEKVKKIEEKAEEPQEKIIYIDQCGVKEGIYRERGRSKRGQPVYARIQGKRGRRANLMAGLRGKETLAPIVFKETINSKCFNAWLEYSLLPKLPPKTVIVLDNASIHKTNKTRELIHKAGCHLLFLPPDSPDLNPIENWWAII